jgi:peptide/nickel transport system substrate-binding protein
MVGWYNLARVVNLPFNTHHIEKRSQIVKRKLLISISLVIALTMVFTIVASARPAEPGALATASQASTQASQAAQASALPYDAAVIATFGEPQNLDPAMDYETAGGEIIQQVYEPLLFYKKDKVNEFVPMLATAWSISPDELVYTFYIRPNVKFHNGNPLTVEDVAYTFQRGILQGGGNSPQWLLTEPLLGLGINDVTELIDPSGALIDDRAALQQVKASKLLAACQTVQNAIQVDNVNGTVTFRLAQPWGPFLVTLAGSWGGIMDKEWTSQNGGWDGSCSTWQNYYAPSYTSDPFYSLTNGTGPFKLDHWTAGVELVMARNANYWRLDPMWPDGPFGSAAFATVTFKYVNDEATRFNMLVGGQADFAALSGPFFSQLDPYVLLSYPETDAVTGTLEHTDGVLKSYTGGLATSATDAAFNYNIATGGPRNYVGSGALDGAGIPTNFFTDIHVRKGFNYAFDWAQYNTTAMSGNGIQRTGPIIKGLMGYYDGQPTYSYNPTLALQELNQAWGGQVGTNGFVMTLAYNTGNASRKAIVDILKANLEALSPNFHVNLIEITYNEYTNDQRARYLPIMTVGWSQDMPHPHNWVVPYLIGTYASRQSIPTVMRDAYRAKIYQCVGLSGAAARVCYEQLQNMTYVDVTDIFLMQAQNVRTYTRAEVRGYYLNQGLSGRYFYAYSKGPIPTTQSVTPAAAATATATTEAGTTISATFAAGSVAQQTEIVITPDAEAFDPPDQFLFGKQTFFINAYVNGEPLDTLTFATPVIVEIQYTPAMIGGMPEDELVLAYWDGSAWQDAACGPYVRDLVNNVLQIPVCHLSEFALAGTSHNLYLPVILR